jgi:hypothetical protein
MDSDDGALPFVAGLLRHASEHDGKLTKKQHETGGRVFRRVRRAWEAGVLDCQLEIETEPEDEDEDEDLPSLEYLEPQGRA